MGYHSRWNGYEEKSLIGCGVYPLKYSKGGAGNGPAPRLDVVVQSDAAAAGSAAAAEEEDIIDEALYFFKPHMLFRTYSIKGCADRVVLYLTMYLNQCLKKIVGLKRDVAMTTLITFANESFSAPGEKGFPFNSFFPTPANEAETTAWKDYMRQLRLEGNVRLLEKVFLAPEENGTGNKFWMVFAKSTFLMQK